MQRLACSTLLVLVVSLLPHARGAAAPSIEPNKNVIEGTKVIGDNWVFGSNVSTIVYARNFLADGRFAYITWDSSKKWCLINTVSTKNTPFETISCQYFFKAGEGTINLEFIHMTTVDKNPGVTFEWTNKLENGETRWLMSKVNTDSCRNGTINLDSDTSTGSSTDINMINDLSAVKEFETGEIDTVPGHLFAYADEKNETQSKLKIFHTNHETGDIKLFGQVEISNKGKEKRESLAFHKYGICWMDGTDISCEQRRPEVNHHDEKVMTDTHMTLPELVDWFAVYNIAEPAMLVITGKCPKGKCDQYEVYKVEGNNKVKGGVLVGGVDLPCENASQALTVDVAEDSEQKDLCFHLVCLEKRVNEQANEKSLAYRKSCISKDTLNKAFSS